MKKKTKAKPTVIGGYASKRAKKLAELSPKIQHPAAEPKPLGPKIPPGIKEVLATMSQLNKDISEITKAPYTVSIELDKDNEWVLIVRGWDPPFEYYGGYRVIYRKATFVRNPLVRGV